MKKENRNLNPLWCFRGCDMKVTNDDSSSVSFREDNLTHTHLLPKYVHKIHFNLMLFTLSLPLTELLILSLSMSVLCFCFPLLILLCRLSSCVIRLMETDTGATYQHSLLSWCSLSVNAKACVIIGSLLLSFLLFLPGWETSYDNCSVTSIIVIVYNLWAQTVCIHLCIFMSQNTFTAGVSFQSFNWLTSK